MAGDASLEKARVRGWDVAAVNPACPHLPQVSQRLDYTITRRHAGDRGAGFALDALRYAQSLWQEGKPAQAVLQIDKAWLCGPETGGEFRGCGADPYRALAWIVRHAADGTRGFLGNPVRHFQHLATRVRGPHRELRAWRAWYCLHLAEAELPAAGFPRDGRQIAREGIWIPRRKRCLAELAARGWPGEQQDAGDAFGS